MMRAVSLVATALPVVSAATRPLLARSLLEKRQEVQYAVASAQGNSTATMSPNSTSGSSPLATSIVVVDVIPAVSKSTVYSYKQITVTGCETESEECTKASPDIVTAFVPVTTTMCPITWTISYVSDFSADWGTWPTSSPAKLVSNWDYDNDFTEVPSVKEPYTNSSWYQSSGINPMADGTLPYVSRTVPGSQSGYNSTVILTMTGDEENYAFPSLEPVDSYSSTAINASDAPPNADLASSAADISTITQTQSSTITVTRNSQSNSSEGSPEQRTSFYERSTVLKLPCSDCLESASIVTGVMYAMSEDLTTTITGEITSLVVVTLFRDDGYLIAPTENAVPLSRSVTVDGIGGISSDEASELGREASLLPPSNYLVVSPEIYALVPPGSGLPIAPAWSSPVDSQNYLTESEDYLSLMPTEPLTNIDAEPIEPMESVPAEETMLMWSSGTMGTLASPSVTESLGISSSVVVSSSVPDTTDDPEGSELAETEAPEETETPREPGPMEADSMSRESAMFQGTEPVAESSIADETATSSFAGPSNNIEILTETEAPEETDDFETETEGFGTDTMEIDISGATETPDTYNSAMTDNSVESYTLNEMATSESVNSGSDVTNGANASDTNREPDESATPEIDILQTDALDLDSADSLNPEARSSRVADALIGIETLDEIDFLTSNSPDETEAPGSSITLSESDAADTNFMVETDVSESDSDTMDENYATDIVIPNVTDMPEQSSSVNGLNGSVGTDRSEETEVTEEIVTSDDTITLEDMEASDVEEMSRETEDVNLTATDVAIEDSSENSLTNASETVQDTAILEESSTSAPIAETGTSNSLVSSEGMMASGDTAVFTGPEVLEGSAVSEALPSTVVVASLEESQTSEAPETSERPANVEKTPESMSSEVSEGSESDEESEINTESRTPEETDLLRTSAVTVISGIETLAETESPLGEAQTVEDFLISLDTIISVRSDSAATLSSAAATADGADETEELSSTTISGILDAISSDEDEPSMTIDIPGPTENLIVSTGALQSTDTDDDDISDITSAPTGAEESEGLLQSIGSPSESGEVMNTSGSATSTPTEVTLQPVSENMTLLLSENELSSISSTDIIVLSTFISSIANTTATSSSTAMEYTMSQNMPNSSSSSLSTEVDTIGNSTSATSNSLVADANSPTSSMSPMASPQSTSIITMTASSTLINSTTEGMESTQLEASISSMTVSNSSMIEDDNSNRDDSNGINEDFDDTTDAEPLTTSMGSGPMGTGSVPAMYASTSSGSMEARSKMVTLSFSAAVMILAQC